MVRVYTDENGGRAHMDDPIFREGPDHSLWRLTKITGPNGRHVWQIEVADRAQAAGDERTFEFLGYTKTLRAARKQVEKGWALH